jgi:hypothetical protein
MGCLLHLQHASEGVGMGYGSLFCVLETGRQRTGRLGDKSWFAATPGPDSGAGMIKAPVKLGLLRTLARPDTLLFMGRGAAPPHERLRMTSPSDDANYAQLNRHSCKIV